MALGRFGKTAPGRERLDEVENGKLVYVICQSGLRSYIACRILEGNGYEAYNFSGGHKYYVAVVSGGEGKPLPISRFLKSNGVSAIYHLKRSGHCEKGVAGTGKYVGSILERRRGLW